MPKPYGEKLIERVIERKRIRKLLQEAKEIEKVSIKEG